LSDSDAYSFSETESDFTVATSQPLPVNGSMKVTVDRVGYGEECSTSASLTNVEMVLSSSPQLLGASVNTKYKKQSAKNLHI